MEQNTLDQLKEYFLQHKKEVKDGVFTQEVMRKLPSREKHYYIIYLFLFIGIFLFILLNGHQQVVITISDLTRSIPQLKMPFTQSLFVLIGAFLVIFSIFIIGADKEDSVPSI